MKHIVWSIPAVDDLESIHSFIARDSQVYADTVILEIIESIERLITFPESGRFVPELNDEKTREIIVGNYRIVYEWVSGTIRILTVLHGARQFPK
ncbi:MAG: type II toxin-antitoxin system RelE/ParE family toxin [Acidobacteria bacterium]|nr:type II toxin-antitoxin system RelE/ParE family toxin [Acidobacteriota bacterium]MCG2815291.1 type II toxin-antitoxin system RelE/ParE family toxin [Candidatus Aminicenantes bacterium]